MPVRIDEPGQFEALKRAFQSAALPVAQTLAGVMSPTPDSFGAQGVAGIRSLLPGSGSYRQELERYNQAAAPNDSVVDEQQGPNEDPLDAIKRWAGSPKAERQSMQAATMAAPIVWHRTSPVAAAEIRKTGKMVPKEDGLFFSSEPNGQASGFGTEAVKMDVPSSKLQLDDEFPSGEQHFRVPAKIGEPVDVSQWLKGAQLADAIDGMTEKLRAAHPDVKFDLMRGSGGVVTLSSIRVPETKRGAGLGESFMRDLTAMADEQGVRLAASPSSDFGGVKSRIRDWNARHGFVDNKGKYKDFTVSETMLRDPMQGIKTHFGNK
jgi:hypothetical protein